MTGRRISIIFVGVVVAAVVGWLVGNQLQDSLSRRYDVAVAVVAEGLEVASPSPEATPSDSPTSTPEPTESSRPGRPASVICEGEPPAPNCDCDLQNREWVWSCPLPDDAPSAPPSEPED